MANTNEARGWQVNKNLAEVNRHMLDNQIACDVTFHVHSEGDRVIEIPTHKYMLVSRSPVFEAMFCDGFRESSNVVEIVDIEPDVIRDMLSFIYTEDVFLTPDNVLHLMYAANKYILVELVDLCTEYLGSHLTAENVCAVANQCVVYTEYELLGKCLTFIGRNTDDVLSSEGFPSLTPNALKKILEYDDFSNSTEKTVFEACKSWAKHNSVGDNPTDDELRSVFGDCLFQIRFGDMTPDELVEMSDILSDQEVKLFHSHIENKSQKEITMKLSNMGFNLMSRFCEQSGKCNRFTTFKDHFSPLIGTAKHMINFTTSHRIKITAIGIFGRIIEGRVLFKLQLNDADNVTLSTVEGKCFGDGRSSTIPMYLNPPIYTHPDTVYTLCWHQFEAKECTYFSGGSGKSSVQCAHVTFTFFNHSESHEKTNVTQGQIPAIHFRY